MSVTTGVRLHSINPASGVTAISPPSIRLARLRYSLGRIRYPYIWRQGFPSVTGTMLDLVCSKKNSRRASPTYATLSLAHNTSIFARHSKDLYHLLPLSNTFLYPAMNTGTEQYRREYSSLTLFSMAPPLDSLTSSSTIATSVGSHYSCTVSKTSRCRNRL